MGNWMVFKLKAERQQQKKKTQRKGEAALGTKTKRRGMMDKKLEGEKITHDMKQDQAAK